jgi:cell division GTPase FtsZ
VRRAAATECDLIFGAVVRPDRDREVEITIIAANFQGEDSVVREEKRHVRRERVPLNADLDVPTFMRRERGSDESE